MEKQYTETKEVYDDRCLVLREDTGQEVEGEILHFKPKEFIKVVVGKSVALNLQYEPFCDRYLGEKNKMPFISIGPKKLK